jgi:Tetracyclin repressor-like, C-terminal domain/Bacterial regulatory proteins, tetR family
MVPPSQTRPGMSSTRVTEILHATVAVLQEVGYDQLTMDAVAHAARAGKATLYRRWSSKAELVVEAVCHTEPVPTPNTGQLRLDLLAMCTGPGGLSDRTPQSVLAGLLTAMHRDLELADIFRARFLAPKRIIVTEIFNRAQQRGEIPPDLSLEIIPQILPALVIHRVLVLGESTDLGFIEQVLDTVVLPACSYRDPHSSHQSAIGKGLS